MAIASVSLSQTIGGFPPSHGGGGTNKTALVKFFMDAKKTNTAEKRGCKNRIIFPPWWGGN